RYVGMGGGLGIPYADETPPPPERYGAALGALLGPLGLTVVLEPGRVIVGNAGILLSRVVRVKEGKDRRFVLLDAGMNDLIRPAPPRASSTATARCWCAGARAWPICGAAKRTSTAHRWTTCYPTSSASRVHLRARRHRSRRERATPPGTALAQPPCNLTTKTLN